MDQDVLNIAIENLSTIPELMIEIAETTNIKTYDIGYDGVVVILFKGSSFEMPFMVKRKVTTAQIPFLKDSVSKDSVIIFESASKPVKEQLRSLGINYIEISGNAFLSKGDIFLFIDTKKKVKLEDISSSAAFSKTGLKVIYQLLINPDSVNYTYRELGRLAGVSIDSISRVYRELVSDKYLVKVNQRKHKIIDLKRLFKDWVPLFNKTLRPKLKQRSFRFSKEENIHSLLDFDFNGQIGGELAAERLSNYNIAERATIYVEGSFVDLAKDLRLRPDINGKIQMIEKFWNDSTINASNIFVGAPLVYADLIANPNPRNFETAKIIYDEFVYQYS